MDLGDGETEVRPQGVVLKGAKTENFAALLQF